MHRGTEIPRSLKPPAGPQQQCGWPQKHAYGKAGYGTSGEIDDSRIAVVLATFYKMAWKWPIWLQAKMMRATLGGLPQGISYGCALGTIVGVEAGYSHTVADMTCTQVWSSHRHCCKVCDPSCTEAPVKAQPHLPGSACGLKHCAEAALEITFKPVADECAWSVLWIINVVLGLS